MPELSGKEYKVLLIEDNPGDSFLIKFYLEESPVDKYSFQLAETLNAGIELYLKEGFDIVLMDMHLPDAIGLDTVREFFKRVPNALVIVLTGLTDERIGLETLKLGAQDFLTKGKFEASTLNKTIKYAFERFQLNNKLQQYRNQLNHLSNCFISLQKMMNVSHIEYSYDEDKFFISDPLLSLLGEQVQNVLDRNSFIQLLPADLQLIVEDCIAKKCIYEGTHEIHGKQVKVKICNLLNCDPNSGETDNNRMNMLLRL